MLQELNALRELVAPSKYGAALWAVGYVLLVAVWCLWSSRRLDRLIERIRAQDTALWRALASPQNSSALASARNWSTFRRLRVDPLFAQQFDQRIVEEIRALQRLFTAGLLVMGLSGLLVMYLAWPHR